jgi:ATP-dependent RNA helicase DeaD
VPRYQGTDDIPASIPTIEVAAELEPAEERITTPSHEVPSERPSGGPEGERSSERSGEDRSPRGRVFLTLGEADGADEAKVREAVASHAPGTELLAVELRRSHAFLLVPPEAVDGLVAALHGKAWGEKTLAAEKARRRRR